MSGSRRGGTGRDRDARSPRQERAGEIERHPPGESTSTGDAAASARSTHTGRRDSVMQDPDTPEEARPRGRSASGLSEDRQPTPGAGQGIGAGARRRAGSNGQHPRKGD